MNTFDLKKFLVENKLTSNSRLNEEEGSGYSSVEYQEGPGASEEELQKIIGRFKKDPFVWKNMAKNDFESMAAGENGEMKADYYPEWKKEDFQKVLAALENI